MQKKLVSLKKILLDKKYAPDQNSAENLILEGKVSVNNREINNPDTLIYKDSNIEIKSGKKSSDIYVSRGGIKAEKVFRELNLSITGKQAVDIGASTGGFTDFMLKKGAKHVTAIDVGYGIISWSLRMNPKVTLLERTNIKEIKSGMIQYLSDFTIVDLSFISIGKVFEKILEITRDGGEILMLVKPQFEAAREEVEEKGIITRKDTHIKVLKKISGTISEFRLNIENITFSGIKGTKGNIEFWIYLKKNFCKNISNQEETYRNYDRIIENTVNAAHEFYKK
jgi:23S rRNA (cytidine1920-2'-O)/16S rRNA (cytidine1409-2'-O)-methyltransferase